MDDLIRQHWSGRADGYGEFTRSKYDSVKERTAWEGLYSEVLEGSGRKVLDCGCGPGAATLRLVDLGYSVTGLDFSAEMIEEARRNMERYGKKAAFVQGDAEDLPFEDSSFDVVVSQYMLWTVPHPEKVIGEWHRVLRPGGRLVYVDGDWFKNSSGKGLNYSMMRFVQTFKPRKQSSSSKKEFSSERLWSADAVRPDADARMLADAGFVGIRQKRDIARRVMPGMAYYLDSMDCEYFMMVADKPGERPRWTAGTS